MCVCVCVCITVTAWPPLSYTEGWGPVEVAAAVAGPVFLLCVVLLLARFLFQHHQRAYGHRHRLDVEDPSTEHLYLAKDKTLQDLIYDLSTSGSGSGKSSFIVQREILECV